MTTTYGITCAWEPSMAKNSSPSKAPKTGAQLPDNLEEREKWPKKAEKTFIAAITATAESRVPTSVANWNVHRLRR